MQLRINPADRRPALVDRSTIRRLGLIALATDMTSERDFARCMPHDRAGVHTTRVRFDNPTTPDNLLSMAPRLSEAAALILPGEPLDAICYSCTSASVVIGDAAVSAAVQAARPGVPVVTPSGAARSALAALGAGRIAILTPYLVQTSEPVAGYFAAHGFDIARIACFGLEDDRDMAHVVGQDIVQQVCALNSSDVEAVFIACTALPAMALIETIECRIGKPVLTANQVTIWAMLAHAGIDYRPSGAGTLFDCPLPKLTC